MTEAHDKSFSIKDKRQFTETGETRVSDQEEVRSDAADKAQAGQEEASDTTSKKPSAPLPEINFSTFILSLSSSALLHFGEIPDPVTNKRQRNLFMAKQTIDILGMLKQKTAGNLTPEEEGLLDNLLYDLRMRYIHESKKETLE